MKPDKIDIEKLKEQYGEIKIISVDGKTGYYRKPDMKIWRYAIKAIDGSKTEFKRLMAIGCFVAGDKVLNETPYIEDIAEEVQNFVDYSEAEVEIEGNAYRVKVLDKSCLLKPVNVEIQTLSERENRDDIPFKTQQNMLKRMWIEGDDELKDPTYMDYHMPTLRALKDLRTKHTLSVKNA
jgi:hypothetical protein